MSYDNKPDPATGQKLTRRGSIYGGDGDKDDMSFNKHIQRNIASESKPGLEPVPQSRSTKQKINQDRCVVEYPYCDDLTQGLFCVFDGHGRHGEKVAEFCKKNVPVQLAAHPSFESDPVKALKETFISVNNQLPGHKDAPPTSRGLGWDASVSGTTAVAVLQRGNHLWVANAGDSRAVLARRKASNKKGEQWTLTNFDLSEDQKPDTPAEKARIVAAGGVVTPGLPDGSPSRVWHNLRGLAMSRSIGDLNAEQVGVIPEPEVKQFDVLDQSEKGGDEYMILASDGVWEFLSSQDAINIVKPKLDADDIGKAVATLVQDSSDQWKREEGDYRDDITVVIVKLPYQFQEQEEEEEVVEVKEDGDELK